MQSPASLLQPHFSASAIPPSTANAVPGAGGVGIEQRGIDAHATKKRGTICAAKEAEQQWDGSSGSYSIQQDHVPKPTKSGKRDAPLAPLEVAKVILLHARCDCTCAYITLNLGVKVFEFSTQDFLACFYVELLCTSTL